MARGEKKDERFGVEEKYKALVETAADAIFTLDLFGRFTFVNPAAERISGYSEEELVGKHFRELLPAKYVPACLNVFQKALRGQPTPPLEIQMITKQGERVPLELLGRPIKRGRRAVEIIGIARDITERKRAEEALGERVKELTCLRTVSRDMQEDLSVDELCRRVVQHLVPAMQFPEITVPVIELDDRRFTSKRYTDGLLHSLHAEIRVGGEARGQVWVYYAEERPFLIPEEQNLINGVAEALGLWLEQKRAEEALRESEDKYRNLIERANDGIAIIQDTIIRYANPRLAEMWGGTVQEVIGTPFTDHIHPDELPRVVDRYKRRMRGKDVTPIYETVLRHKDGSKLYAELNAGIITYQGKPADLVIVRDITERKQAEEALRAEKALMDALMDNIPDSIYFKDRQCRLTRINRTMMRTLDLEEMSQALGKTDVDLFGEEFGRKTLVDDQRIMTTGEAIIGLIESRRLEDEQINWTSTTKVPLHDSNGQIVGLVGITREINELMRAQEEIRHRSEELATLYDVSLDVTSHLNLNALLKTTLLRAIELLRANAGGLYLYHPESQELELIVHQGLSKDYTGTRFALGEGLSGKVAQSGEPLLVDDYQRWEGRSPQWEGEAIGGTLGVPLKHGDDLLGVLYIAQAPGKAFQEGDVRLATLFANQAAIAIENARLFQESQRRTEEMAALRRVNLATLSTLERDQVFEIMLDQLGTVIDYDTAAIKIITPEGKDKMIAGRGLVIYDQAMWEGFDEKESKLLQEMKETRQTVVVHDTSTDERYKRVGDWEAFHSWLGAPLFVKDDLIGYLAVEKTSPGFYDENAVQLLGDFARAAAIALENANLYEETQKRLAETTLLHKVAEIINATLDLKEIFQRVVEELFKTFGYPLLGIYLLEGDRLRLGAQIGYNLQSEPELISIDQGVVGRVARTGQPAFIRDVSQDPDYIPDNLKATNEICVPIRSGQTILGVLNVESDDRRPLTDADLQLLSTLSSHIGVAIENARLYEHSKKRLDELSGLHDISQAFSSMTDVRETFGQLTKRIAQLIGCQMCFIATYDQRAREMRAEPPGYGISDELVHSFHYKVDGPARESWNFRLQGPLLANDITQIADFFSWWIEHHGVFNLLVVPLSIEGRITGLAYAANKSGGFAQDDTRLLTIFANQVAIAIENARLYEETQKRLAETTVLHKVAEVINATLDLKEIFQRVVEELSTTFGYRLVDIYLLEEDGLRLQANVGYDAQTTIELIPLEHGVVGRVARTKEPAFICDVSQDPDYIPAYPDIISEICVPVKSGGTLLGTLNVESDEKRPLTDDDLQLLSALSSHIGVAIENARLYEKEQRRSAQRRTITEVGRRAAAILEMDALLSQVVELIAQNFGYYHVHIFQIDPDSEYAVYKAGTEKTTLAIAEEGFRLKVGKEGIIGWVAQHDQPLLANDVGQESHYYPHPALPDTRSELAVPIHAGGKVLGVLDVQSTELDAFDESDLDTLQTLADQLAVAMENAHLYEETQRLAITDGLTGLYNLRYFYETLEKEIQRSERYDRSVSLIILDIDDFKRYNDTYGHLAGDDLLVELARLMSKMTRRTDILARYGGEEFAIILPETETEGAVFVAERLLEKVRGHRFLMQDGQTIGRITISLGVATYPDHVDSAKALVDAADKAMLQAKRAGKNQIAVLREAFTELEPL